MTPGFPDVTAGMPKAARDVAEAQCCVACRTLQRRCEGQAREMESLQARHTTALVRAGDWRRATQAAVAIQQAWRALQRRQLTAQHAVLRAGWEADRVVMSAEQRRTAADMGRTLVIASLQQIEVRCSCTCRCHCTRLPTWRAAALIVTATWPVVHTSFTRRSSPALQWRSSAVPRRRAQCRRC
jgi:hypothetical protein